MIRLTRGEIVVFAGVTTLWANLPNATAATYTVTSTVATSGGIFNWGDATIWSSGDAPGTFPNAVDATISISTNIGSANLSLDVQNTSDVNQSYRIGDFSYTDTASTYRALVLQNGTLIVDTTDKTALWQNNSSYAGTPQPTTFASTLAMQAAADQTLELRNSATPTTSATDTVGTRFGFAANATWSGFSGTLKFAKGLFQPTAANALPQSVAITLGTGSDVAFLKLTSTQSQSVAGLNGNAVSFVHNTGSTTVSPTLTILGTAAGDYAGAIGTNGFVGFTQAGVNLLKQGAQTQKFSGPITNSGSVTVEAGTLELSGDNGYSGGTSVTGGTLRVNNLAGSGTGSGAVVIGASGTLGGTGTVGGATSIAGTLAPGQSAESLDFTTSLTLQSGAVSNMEIDGLSRGVVGGYDAVNVGTTLAYAGTLNAIFSQTFPNNTAFNLFDFQGFSGNFTTVSLSGAYSGSLSHQGLGVWTGTAGGQSFTFRTDTGELTIAIPEPASLSLLGIAGLILRRRR